MRRRVAARLTWSRRCRDPEWEGAGNAQGQEGTAPGGLLAGTCEARRPKSTQLAARRPGRPCPRRPCLTLGLDLSIFGAREILRESLTPAFQCSTA